MERKSNNKHEVILEMKGITKRFPGVLALENVDFSLRQGEIHALVGENGAGKSTLMKVLGGAYRADEGEILFEGEPLILNNPSDAIQHKIGIIYQEFNLVSTLDIAHNMFLGREPQDAVGTLKKKEMYEKSTEILARLGLTNIDCRTKVRHLSVAVQQLVEIGKAVFQDVRVLVMDEPTAVLTDRESEQLFDLMLNLKARGISIIYISHRLEEVIRLCDRITVLRDGRNAGELDNQQHMINKDVIVSHMVGRELGDYYPFKTHEITNEILLDVRGITAPGVFEDISFQLHEGEILGFAGLVGAGRSEIMEALFGVRKIMSGEVYIKGERVQVNNPENAIAHGIGFVPEDRKRDGLVLGMPLSDNMVMASLNDIAVGGHILKRKKKNIVNDVTQSLNIRPPQVERKAQNFSGGNQQKGVIAKWLAINPRILILDEPTRGIDVGAKIEIYNIVNELAKNGLGVIVVSSELPELMGICDRVLVIREGMLSGEFTRSEFEEERIMNAATV